MSINSSVAATRVLVSGFRIFGAACAASFVAANASAQMFAGLGTLPSVNYSQVFALSGDGRVAVGFSDHAFRWTRDGGMADLGTMPGGTTSLARSVSDDGLFVTGDGNSSEPFYSAFLWSEQGGLEESLPAFGLDSHGLGISADGSTVVGFARVRPTGYTHAFRWTAVDGMQDLGSLTESGVARANAANADGSVVIGTAASRAFRWTAQTGMVDLGVLPGGLISSAFAVSRDGSTVVGWSATGTFTGTLFRWTQAGGMAVLPGLSDQTQITGIGADGNAAVIVGSSSNAAVMWTDETGLVSLATYFAELGLDLTGWSLTSAVGVSNDGRTIVGNGVHNGASEAWIATLPGTSPCPADCGSAGGLPGHDGLLDNNDFIAFIGLFFAQSPAADLGSAGGQAGSDGRYDNNDFIAFISLFFAGC